MARRETLNISLTKQLHKFVQDKIKSGRYTSASEVVREGLRMVEEREKARERSLHSIRRQIDQGIAALDRGDSVDGDTFFRSLERRAKSSRRRAG